MFQWTLTSDGYDYAPGGIGCCKRKTIPTKRKAIQDSLGIGNLGAKATTMKLYSTDGLLDTLKGMTSVVCTGNRGVKDKNHKIHNNSRDFYKERLNIEDFTEFKQKKK